jgi:FKBP12-rapamycin complex-associated protein
MGSKAIDEEDRYQSNVSVIGYLRDFSIDLGTDIGIGPVDDKGRLVLPDQKLYGDYTRLLAECHVELGDWLASMKAPEEAVSRYGFAL